MSIAKLNLDLARALGFRSPEDLTGVTLRIMPHRWPQVRATFLVRTSEGLEIVMKRYTIRLADESGAGCPPPEHSPERPVKRLTQATPQAVGVASRRARRDPAGQQEA